MFASFPLPPDFPVSPSPFEFSETNDNVTPLPVFSFGADHLSLFAFFSERQRPCQGFFSVPLFPARIIILKSLLSLFPC